MQIEDFKRWHWVLIALVVGGLLAYGRSMVSPDEQGGGVGISAIEFAQSIGKKTTTNAPLVKEVLVYPAEPVTDPTTGELKKLNYVVCSLLRPTNPGKGAYKLAHFNAEVPFKVANLTTPSGPTYSVQDYLTEMRSAFPETKYRYAWWAKAPMQAGIWMGGAVLLIGGVWPSLIGLMIGAGLGRSHDKSTDAYDLDRFKASPPSKAAAIARPGISPADARQLQTMQEQLERDLASAGMQMTASQADSSSTSSQTGPIRTLGGAAVEITPSATPDDNEPKEYTGDYYPVVKAHATEDKKR